MPIKQDFDSLYASERIKFESLMLKESPLTTTGSLTFTSISSGQVYNSSLGETGLLTTLQIALNKYIISADDWNNVNETTNELNNKIGILNGAGDIKEKFNRSEFDSFKKTNDSQLAENAKQITTVGEDLKTIKTNFEKKQDAPNSSNVIYGETGFNSKNTTGANNTVTGRYSMSNNTTGNDNTANGYCALYSNTTGNNNSAIGSDALQKNTTGSFNTAIGKKTLYANTTGIFNIAIGESSLMNNIYGASNVACGVNTLQNNKTGNNNTAMGMSALYSNNADNNTAYGGSALYLNTTGCSNTATGNNSLEANVTGNQNSAYGHLSLKSNTTGSRNTAIGFQTLGSNETGAYNTAIGTCALAFDFNMNLVKNLQNCTGIGNMAFASGNNQVQLGNNETTAYCYGAVQNRSDMRDKADIKNTALGLDFIKALRPVEYRWDYREYYNEIIEKEDGTTEIIKHEKDGSKKRKRLHQGFIAQEVKQIMDAQNVDFAGYQDHGVNGGCDVLSLGYAEFIAPMVKAIQEQQKIIEKQGKEIEELRELLRNRNK